MKKKIIYIIAISLLGVYSCKKNHDANVSTLHTIKFNVADFAKSTGPFKTNAVKAESVSGHDSLVKYVKVIYFLIYDSSGNRVTTVKQVAAQADFGTFTTQLKSGSYTIDIAAGSDYFALTTSSNSTLTTDAFSYSGYKFTENTYFKQLAVTVSTTDNTYNAILDRVVGLLQINIEDPVPVGANVLQMSVFNNSQLSATGIPTLPQGYFYGGATQPDGTYARYTLVAGSTNNKFSAILLASTPGSPSQVTLQVADDFIYEGASFKFNKMVAVKTIQFNILPNKTNLVTGKLFGISGDNGFKVQYDTTWNATPLHYGF